MAKKDTWIVNLTRAAALLAGIACASSAGATTLSFSPQQTFAAGNMPWAVASADLNGDGKPDAVVTNWYDGTVSVYLNTTAPGDSVPSYAAQQTFAVGNAPAAVKAVDVNGDGIPDLIVTNLQDKTVSVLLNTTTPGAMTASFSAQSTYAVGSYAESVQIVDMNGDGMPDLIVGDYADYTVSILINTMAPGDATPSFAAQQFFLVVGGPYMVAIADVNGDGVPDLIATNYDSDTISVLLNTTVPGSATMSFTAPQDFLVGNNPNSVIAADINGDGLPDLIATNESDNTVSVLVNTTPNGAMTPSFADQQTFATGNIPQRIRAVDIDGDGALDLVVVNYNDNDISVLLNTTTVGDSTVAFAAQETFAVGNSPECLAIADVNGDGKLDVIVPNSADNTVSVLLNTTN